MEKEKYFPSWKNEIKLNKKYRMHDLKFVDNKENIKNHHPRAHFIIISNGSLVFNLWEWEENSSTTSLLLIRTSSN